MASSESESSLIEKAVAGDVASLEMLLYRHRKRLTAYVESRFPEALRKSLEPQDIVQDTWLRAIRGISQFRPGVSDPVYRWLVTIARHLIADQLKYYRSAKRNKRQLTPEGSDEEASMVRLLEEMALYLKTPSRLAARHELMLALDGAISRLGADQGLALRLRYLSGLEVKEIARQMDRTEGAVSMLCNRALKALRVEMRSASLYM